MIPTNGTETLLFQCNILAAHYSYSSKQRRCFFCLRNSQHIFHRKKPFLTSICRRKCRTFHSFRRTKNHQYLINCLKEQDLQSHWKRFNHCNSLECFLLHKLFFSYSHFHSENEKIFSLKCEACEVASATYSCISNQTEQRNAGAEWVPHCKMVSLKF